jgi:hypothetical protein
MKAVFKIVLFAALCLALWPALVGAAPPQPAGKLVYDDDFSEKTKSGLEDQLQATDFSRGFHAPGVYHLKDVKAGEIKWVLFPKQSYANLSFALDTYDNSDDFNGDVAQGVIFRAQDANHFYAVIVDPRKGEFAVRKLDGANKWTDLVATKASALIKKESGVNALRVDGDGDKFTVYLNGETLASFSDAAYKQGGIGLIASNTDANGMHMHFDNVKVYTTDTAAPATGQTSGTATGQPTNLPATGQPGAIEPLALAAGAFVLLMLGLWARQRR